MTALSAWSLVTGRLRMAPVGYWDLPDLVALKADPRAFAQMLGGVRSPVQAAEELAQDIQDWVPSATACGVCGRCAAGF